MPFLKHVEGVEVQFKTFVTLALDGNKWQASAEIKWKGRNKIKQTQEKTKTYVTFEDSRVNACLEICLQYPLANRRGHVPAEHHGCTIPLFMADLGILMGKSGTI